MELEQYCETAGQQGGPGLTVAAPSFFCTYGLPPVIAAFKERYPDWEIRLVEANDQDLVDFLRAGVAELGISANGDTAPDMESEVLRMENIILAVPAGFPVNRGLEAYVLDPVCGNEVPGVPLERFAEERFLFMKPGNDMRERGMRLCREAGFSPRIVMELDQMNDRLLSGGRREKGPPSYGRSFRIMPEEQKSCGFTGSTAGKRRDRSGSCKDRGENGRRGRGGLWSF